MNYILNTLKPIPLKDKFFKILSKLNTLENEIISKSFFVKSTLIEDIIFIIVLILLCILIHLIQFFIHMTVKWIRPCISLTTISDLMKEMETVLILQRIIILMGVYLIILLGHLKVGMITNVVQVEK